MNSSVPPPPALDDDIVIDVRSLLQRARRGLALCLGLAIVGLVAGVVLAQVTRAKHVPLTILKLAVVAKRVETGLVLPNGAPFTTDSLRALPVVTEALRRANPAGSPQAAAELQTRIAISEIPGSPATKEWEKLLADGAAWPGYSLIEYKLALSAAATPLDDDAREQLLTEIAGLCASQFGRNHSLPQAGQVFAQLPTIDYVGYVPLLEQELRDLQIQLRDSLEPTRVPLALTASQRLTRVTEVQLPLLIELVGASALKKAPSNEYGPALAQLVKDLRTQLQPWLEPARDPAVLALAQRLARLGEVRLPMLAELAASADLSKEPKSALVLAQQQLAALVRQEQDLQMQAKECVAALELAHATGAGSLLADRLAATRIDLNRLTGEQERLRHRVSRLQAQLAGPQPEAAAFEAALAEYKSVHDGLVTEMRQLIVARQSQIPGEFIRITQPVATTRSNTSYGFTGVSGLILGGLLGLGLSLLRPAPVARSS